MFRDLKDEYIQEFNDILEDYGIDEILAINDLTKAEALYLLFVSGHVEAPENTTINLAFGEDE